MDLFGWFKAAPKLADNVFDMEKGLLSQVGSWVGGQQFTEEEAAEMRRDMAKGVQGYAIATLGENTERSKARREIAIQWIKLQVWLIKLNVLCVFLDYLIVEAGKDNPGFTATIGEITFSPYMWGITGAVSVFFFGTHMMRDSKWGKGDK